MSRVVLPTVSVTWFVGVIVVAHFFAPVGYRWTHNTVSELAAQGQRHKWIMQVGFVGFGVLLNAGIVLKAVSARRASYPDLLIAAYGVCILISGVFCTSPMDEALSYSASEAQMHSAAATMAGVFFSLGVLGYLLLSQRPAQRILHFVFLALVLGCSILFGLAEGGSVDLGRGIAQRLLYVVSLVWLIVGQY